MHGFLLDLDGTLYHGDHGIEGAPEFIEWLKEKGYPFLYVTNNSSRTPEQVAEHLRRTGIAAEPHEVLTSSQAAALYMRDAGLAAGRVMYIGEEGLRTALEEAGVEPVAPEEADASGSVIGAVVQGIDRQFSYAKLLTAVRHIRGGAPYILTNPDHLLPWNGELTPGAGSISASIERASESAPVVIGKPSPIIMRYAIAQLGLEPRQIWVVGDNLATDIRGGVEAGCRTALVLTGLANETNVEQQIARTGVQPERVCRTLQELAERVG